MNIKEIDDILRADPEKAEQFKQALEAAESNGAKGDAEALSMAAAAVGIEITPEQVEQSVASMQPISDEDLELVAGGFENFEDEKGHDLWCLTAWHCYTATLHTSTKNHDASCWSDYMCQIWSVKSVDIEFNSN